MARQYERCNSKNSAVTDFRPVLVVEDNDEDFEILRMAFASTGVANPLVRCVGAQEALALLDRNATENVANLPALVLLDINLPDMDGREVLKRIRADNRLRAIPTVILSTSSNPQDVEKCYEFHASGYLVKPFSLDKFEFMVRAVVDFWLKAVHLPKPVL